MTKMHATAATLAALALASPALATKTPPKTPPSATTCEPTPKVPCAPETPPVVPEVPAPPSETPVVVPQADNLPPVVSIPSVPAVVTPVRVEPLPRIRVRFTCAHIPRGAGIGWYSGRLGFRCPLPARLRHRVVVRVPAVTG